MNKLYFIYGMIISIILMPWIPTRPGLPMLRPEWFVLISGLFLLPMRKQLINSNIVKMTMIVIASYTFSMIYSIALLAVNFNFRDIFVLMQPILYCLIYLFVSTSMYREETYLKIIKISLLAFFAAAGIAIMQYINPYAIEPLLRLYVDQERILAYFQYRATGTMLNPNDLGFLLTIGFALALFTQKQKLFNSLFHKCIIVACFIGLFASGSRTAMICLVAILMIYLVLEVGVSPKGLFFFMTLSYLVIFGFLKFIAQMDIASGLTERIFSFTNLESDGGLMPRIYGALNTLPIIAESWFLGHGPDKEGFQVGGNIDNEYILLLYRFGVVGTFTTIIFVISLALQNHQRSKSTSPLNRTMRNFSWATLIAGGLYAYAAGLFMSFRLFGLLIIIWTISSHIIPRPSLQNRVNVSQQQPC